MFRLYLLFQLFLVNVCSFELMVAIWRNDGIASPVEFSYREWTLYEFHLPPPRGAERYLLIFLP